MIDERTSMSKIINVDTKDFNTYDIVITEGFRELKGLLEPFFTGGKKVAVISDSNVGKLYSEEVSAIVRELGNPCFTYDFPAGEENKNLDTVQDVYEFLIENRFERRDIQLALGGGVVGDLTGFVAATYLRGISFIQIPTSLLAQTDSSIGGKTGVDFRRFKNMVGAFHQPSLVFMNMKVLGTLDKRQFLSGLAEIIKAALIKDKSFLDWIIANTDKITGLDEEALEEMIYRACVIKRDVVQNDPKEKGERALLNFGHTLGHAIERCADFSLFHGECVALGMIAALHISMKRGRITEDEYKRLYKLFETLGYTLKVSGLTKEEITETAKSDKKAEAGVIKYILLDSVGNAVIKRDVTQEETDAALDVILEV